MTPDTCVELTTLRLLRGPADADGSAAAVADHVAGCPRCAGAALAVDAALAELAGAGPSPTAPSSSAAAEERLLARLAAPTLTCVACAREVSRARVRSCPACLAAHHPDCAPAHGRCTRCQARLAPRRRASVLPLLAGGVGGLVVAAAAWGGAGFPDLLRRSRTGEPAAYTIVPSDVLEHERHVVLGRGALASDPRAALDHARRALEGLPASPKSFELRRVRADALALLVRATLRAGSADVGTVRLLEAQLREATRTPRLHLAQAELAWAVSAFGEAYDLYSNAVKDLPAGDPDHLEALAGRLRAAVARERWTDVLDCASAAGRREELILEASCARAAAHAARGDAEVAELEGAEAAHLGRERNDWRGALALADARFRLGRRWAARDALAEARQLGAFDPALDVARGDVLLAAGCLSDALGAADAALARAPEDAAARALRAEVLLELLDVDHALADAARARAEAVPPPRATRAPGSTRTDPWARATRVKARAALMRGDARGAYALARSAEEVDPTVAGALLVATIELDPDLEELHGDAASRAFDDVLRVWPRSIEARRGVLLARLTQRGFTSGFTEEQLDELQKLDPRDPLLLFARARVESGRGQADAARALTLAAARAARDPRRPEGRAFAHGVLVERLDAAAREGRALPLDVLRLGAVPAPLAGGDQAELAFAAALAADPFHAQALVALGLGGLRGDAASAARARALWRRAAASLEPLGPAGAWLLEAQLDAPPAFVVAAAELHARGETEAPRLLHLDMAASRVKRPGRVDTSSDWVVSARELDRLRARAPWDVTSCVLEVTALRYALGSELPPPLASRLEARLAVVVALEETRREERERREAADEGSQAAPLARVQAAPWLAAPWAALAEERARDGEPWSALAAHVRAASLDPGRTAGLAARLQAASAAAELPPGGPPDLVALDRALAEPDPAQAELLRGARFVAESLARPPDPKEPGARAQVEALEELALADPRSTAPQLLLGLVYLAGGGHERAVEHLLYVTVAARSGEACYLAAAAVASDPDATPAALERGVEWLHTAVELGYPVARHLALDARFAELKGSQLAAYLPKE